jgi:hypothetical protein
LFADSQFVLAVNHRFALSNPALLSAPSKKNQGLRGVEWAIFVWIMPESCAFPSFFALRARLEIAMILDGENQATEAAAGRL